MKIEINRDENQMSVSSDTTIGGVAFMETMFYVILDISKKAGLTINQALKGIELVSKITAEDVYARKEEICN